MKKTVLTLIVALSTAGFIGLYVYDPGSSTPTAAPPNILEVIEAPPSAQAARTVDGSAETDKYGTVQVQLVVSDNRISEIRLLRQPEPGRGAEAIKALQQATLTAQSAAIDTVSGATMTSESYLKSLQAALDAR
ncbi:FMN-binding domain-containing protein [Amycolatopsis thailandensis]|uniref:FMN-binding domain-containing protein n=1 Tax=Amycolatopsis thailandensis TaxID=589330 RepID=A0A229S508_9PSEU|nr:FMN-binding protein [Amycolatopsis thailandensis]OXM53986.1 FMN-binding domain-containing protein [Amycolatopsis thailandensis]